MPFVILGIGGIGSVVAMVAWFDIADALNRHRPPDDQIPVIVTSIRDIERSMEPRFRHWRILREFHRTNPESSLYYWYYAGTAWSFLFAILGFGFFFHLYWH